MVQQDVPDGTNKGFRKDLRYA